MMTRPVAPLAPQLAASLKGVAKVGAVNCEMYQELCQAQGVRSYPTIKSYVPGVPGLGVYSGARSAKAILDWALSLIPSQVVALPQRSDLEGFLGACSPGMGTSWLQRAYAALGGRCLRLAAAWFPVVLPMPRLCAEPDGFSSFHCPGGLFIACTPVCCCTNLLLRWLLPPMLRAGCMCATRCLLFALSAGSNS